MGIDLVAPVWRDWHNNDIAAGADILDNIVALALVETRSAGRRTAPFVMHDDEHIVATKAGKIPANSAGEGESSSGGPECIPQGFVSVKVVMPAHRGVIDENALGETTRTDCDQRDDD